MDKQSKNNQSSTNVFYRSPVRRYPMIVRGEGIYLYDAEGKQIIDGTGGPFVVSIGHGVKEIRDAIYQQLEKIEFVHTLEFTTQVQEDLAKKVATLAPEKLNTSMFVPGGSDAVESSIKLARQYHVETGNIQKYNVISLWPSYHGGTLGALSITGAAKHRKYFAPLLKSHPKIPSAYCYRCYYKKNYPECGLICAHVLEKIIKQEGEETISAFIAEPIGVFHSGVIIPPKEYFSIIREICTKHNILMICDEVVTGFGRTGKNFGIMNWGVVPDMITSGKGLSSGYAPIGVVIVHERIHDAIKKGTGWFAHGLTHMGSPVACSAALAVLNYLESNKLVSRVGEMGDYLKSRLNDILKYEIVGDIKGKGLLASIEFVRDKASREPFDNSIKLSERMFNRAMDNGLYVKPESGFVDGTSGDCIMVGPPFITKKEEIDLICSKLSDTIAHVEREIQ